MSLRRTPVKTRLKSGTTSPSQLPIANDSVCCDIAGIWGKIQELTAFPRINLS